MNCNQTQYEELPVSCCLARRNTRLHPNSVSVTATARRCTVLMETRELTFRLREARGCEFAQYRRQIMQPLEPAAEWN